MDYSGRAQLGAQKQIIISLAGGIAQQRAFPRSLRNWHTHSDYNLAADLALTVCGGNGKEASALVKLLEIRTTNLITFHWVRVERIARRLLKKRTIVDAEMLAEIVHSATKRSAS